MLFPKWYSEKTWTVGKNILFTTLVFFSIGLGNLLYSVSQGFFDFSLESFWFYQGLTLTVGIFPVVISTLLVYNLRLKTMVKEATQLNQAVQNETQLGTETIHIPSQNKSEELNLNSQELLAIKAIENYIEVYANQEVKKDRYQFAHTYIGLKTEVLPQNGSFSSLNANGTFDSKKLPTFGSARFVIGGTHFWDHADFYVGIPIINLALSGSKDAFISNGVLTGFRYFLLKIKPNSMRPFVGVGFGGPDFRSKGALQARVQLLAIDSGISKVGFLTVIKATSYSVWEFGISMKRVTITPTQETRLAKLT